MQQTLLAAIRTVKRCLERDLSPLLVYTAGEEATIDGHHFSRDE
jgi:hypothetical protein